VPLVDVRAFTWRALIEVTSTRVQWSKELAGSRLRASAT